jgi:hypothetical protein
MKKLSNQSRRVLTLGRETVRRLSSVELDDVAGGRAPGFSDATACHSRCPLQCGPILE